MSLHERFAAQIITLADAEAFIERAKTLGHGPKTHIGRPGVGLELYIETNQLAEHYQCTSFNECKTQFESDEMARSIGDGVIVCPPHRNSRQFNCEGTGKRGVPVQ